MKTGSENRENISNGILIIISVMVGSNEPEKIGRFAETFFSRFLLHSIDTLK